MRGRPRSASPWFVEDIRGVLDIAQLPKPLPAWIKSKVRVTFTGENAQQAPGWVRLTTSEPYFGGLRYWFVCPNCNRRVGKLYAVAVGALGCRLCLHLVYEWQYRKSWNWRLLLTALRPDINWRRMEKLASLPQLKDF